MTNRTITVEPDPEDVQTEQVTLCDGCGGDDSDGELIEFAPPWDAPTDDTLHYHLGCIDRLDPPNVESAPSISDASEYDNVDAAFSQGELTSFAISCIFMGFGITGMALSSGWFYFALCAVVFVVSFFFVFVGLVVGMETAHEPREKLRE